ncbi:MAG: 16S rRNA (cytosine(1402)-N(4))-methyltransferase RsmH [Caulobacteraceae bacterium]
MTAPHVPVLLTEVVEALDPAPGRVIVDGTFGAGGYSRALLERGAAVIAFDRDPSTKPYADTLARQFPALRWLNRRFSELEDGLAETGHETCDGVTFDVGVSSMQVDDAERGFSFMRDGPLDMRMGQAPASAADIVNAAEQDELARIFWVYGEERQSRRIAKALVRRRTDEPFTRTADLADTVERILGGRRGAPTHPATRVFQALRIAVNEELAELEAGLAAAERVLKPGGRLAVVTFHSLEDRIVKAFLAERSGKAKSVSRHMPMGQAGPPPSFTLLFNGARAASPAETAANPRARSAKLRAASRTDAPAWRMAA